MRVLVISDTHRNLENLEYVLHRIGKIDMLIHLGDVEGQEMIIQSMVSCPFYVVAGNCDYFSVLPKDAEIFIGEKKIFITHGHRYLVNQGIQRLKDEAIARGAQIAMYGHTHVPMIKEGKDVTVLCPGSLSYPRQSGREPSYLILTVDRNGAFQYKIEYIPWDDVFK